MALEKDQSAWLPEPPPARPARRDAAIEAALRKFDGDDEIAPPKARPANASWGSRHRPQLGFALASMLVLVIGIPAAWIGLRNEGSTHEAAPTAAFEHATVATKAPPPKAAAPPAFVQRTAPPPATSGLLSTSPPVHATESAVAQIEAKSEPVEESAAPVVAAAPPPPPPPPAPPPAAAANAQADALSRQAMSQDQGLVVTGSLAPGARLDAPGAAKAVSPRQGYEGFLAKLQTAARSGDRRAVTSLIAFPLRVNFPGGAKSYPDRHSVERDFPQIFTARVMRAIAAQRADQLFVRDQGAMIGDGEVWFRETCMNPACSPAGPVRITAVNP
jgi:hypothetical protein